MTDPTTEDKADPAGEPGGSEKPESGDAQQQKRRRRRRGGKGRKRPSTPESGTVDQKGDEAPPAEGSRPSESRSGGERGEKRRRDSGRRPPARREPQEFEEYEDPEEDASLSRGPRPDTEALENWEEIFENITFADLGLRNSVIKGTDAAGFTHPTKIQAEVIPLILQGKDVLGQSRTGSGKTAAFGLPLFNLIEREVPFQVLVLGPTRELALQISQELRELGKFTPIQVATVYGGQPIHKQANRLEQNPEIVVATPGRLLDMHQRRHLHFKNVRIAVLDEVDRMLDIGFRDDIRKILGMMDREHQTIFVSATIGEEIEKLARKFMRDPTRLETSGGSLTVSLVQQHYIPAAAWDKKRMLHHVLTHEEPDVTLVFCRMKRTVDDVARYLKNKGVDAHAIHGDMYQGRRNSVMKRFRAGELSVLVASDLAARGLDVEGITHVINYDLPDDPEVYIHRIGRTARAGRDGIAWSFVTPEEGPLLTEIEKLANAHIDEKPYPEFEPGPLPDAIKAEKDRDEARMVRLQSRSRFTEPTIPTSRDAEDRLRFPGGIVPAKMPEKRLRGRIKTARSMKSQDAPDPKPEADP